MAFQRSLWRPATLLATIVVVGCSGSSGTADLKSARDLLAAGNPNGSVVALKTVLQANESNAEARFLLGRALVELGTANLAVLEFRKAQQLNYPADELVPALAQALLASGKDKTITDEFSATSLGNPEAQAALKSTVAMAYFRQKVTDKAEAALAAATEAKPQYVPAKLVMARMRATQGQTEEASKILNEILSADPKNAEAWQVAGTLRGTEPNGAKSAIDAYLKALEVKPNYLPAHLALIEAYIAQKQVDDAGKQLESLKKFHPNHPRTRQLAAALAVLRQDYAGAKTLLQPLLQSAPEDVKLLLLGGAVELRLGGYVKAEAYLGRALQRAPDTPLVRKLLVQTYLKQGKADKALVTLQPLMAGAQGDSFVLSTAAEAHLRAGNLEQAESLFKAAAKAAPQDPNLRTALALARLSTSNSELVLQELETIAASDKGTVADLAIITSHLRRGEHAKALQAIEALAQKMPTDPLPPLMRGQAELAQNNLSAARQSFLKSQQIDKSFGGAAMALAALDIREKKLTDARTVLNNLLGSDPRHVGAMLMLAEVQHLSGGSADEVAAMIIKAQTTNPTDESARIRLIEHYRNSKAFKKSLDAAQEAMAAVPDSLVLLDALGKSQALVGDDRQALSTFRKLATLQPTSALPHLRMAEVQTAANDRASARQSLRRAIEAEPSAVVAYEGVVKMALEDKRPADAIAAARSLQQQRPKDAIGHLLEGDIEVAQKNWGAAALAYRKAHALQPSFSTGSIKLHRVLMLANKKAEADQFATAVIKDNSRDTEFIYYLGDRSLAADDFSGAEKYYQLVLSAAPNSGMALNNLAWIFTQQKKSGALQFAERAVAVAPDNAAFLDTLAQALAENGQIDKALETQKKAVALKPDFPGLRLTYATLMRRAGKEMEARVELEALQKLGTGFSSHAEVSRQLQLLKK